MQNEHCGTMGHRCISWSAIIIGAFVGIGLGFLLNLFSIAIGLSLIKTAQDGVVTLAIGGFIGLLIGVIASMFTAGFAAGYVARPYCTKNLGVVYGFVSWCLALILAMMLTTHLTQHVSAYTNFVTKPSLEITSTNKATTAAVTETKKANSPAVTINSQNVTTQALGMTAFLIFVLFSAGALASSLGGYCGMSCRSDECH
jgi:hypothetical protein